MVVELIDNIVDTLNDIDIYVVECIPFIYEKKDKVYKNIEDLRKDVVSGNASMFFNVQAIIGNSIWGIL